MRWSAAWRIVARPPRTTTLGVPMVNHTASGGADKRCTMEARIAGHQPLAVSHHAAGLDEAFRGAAEKLKRALDSTLGRLYGRRDRDSIRKDGDAVVE